MNKYLLTILISLSSLTTYGTEYFLVKTLNFEAGRFGDKISKPEFPLEKDEYFYNSTAVNWGLDLVRYYDFGWYWTNRIEAWATNKQYRTVFWEYENGFNFNKIDIYWYHKSEHFLDDYSGKHFPVNDRLMFRLNFIDKKRGFQ